MSSDSMEETAGLTSYELPPSPSRGRSGSDSVSVWVDSSNGDDEIQMALASPSLENDSSFGQPNFAEVANYPLVPYESSSLPSKNNALIIHPSATPVRHTSSSSTALVPFQKLQIHTDLHQTMLPYNQTSHSSSSSSPLSSPSSASAMRQFVMDTSDSSDMSNEFMQALRLNDWRTAMPQPSQQNEPQLSVRVRSNRVELADASEDADVDFLGPAENIKKLFKLPYSDGQVSLAVHRVGQTLVVDGELPDTELPTGFNDIDGSMSTHQPEAQLALPATDESPQDRLLYEKFVYETARQSLEGESKQSSDENLNLIAKDEEQHANVVEEKPLKRSTGRRKAKKNRKKNQKKAQASSDGSNDLVSSTTEPTYEQSVDVTERQQSTERYGQEWWAARATGSVPSFQRTVEWKFQDMTMLLGSQVLLFGNADHPAVSLKLHDMDTDLSLATLLDYYLDNVISNIPELAICMHSRGVVRGYKLLGTNEIPYLSGTDQPIFDVQDVSVNATMLLRFLRENCSRPNGTYWLYRAPGEGSLRLYDVDVLSQGKQLKWKYARAMLCYRFASRASRLMEALSACERKALRAQLQQRQRDLLQTCLRLLQEVAEAGGASHDAVCSSVREQLADTFLRECDDVGSSQDKDIVPLLLEAKEHLSESIRFFRVCVEPEEEEEEEEEMEESSMLEEDDIGDFMQEELLRLELKFGSTCLQLSQTYTQQEMWSKALASVLEAMRLVEDKMSVEKVDPFFQSRNELEEDAKRVQHSLDHLTFNGTGGDNGAVLMCSTTSSLRSRALESIGDLCSRLPSISLEPIMAAYDALSGESSVSFRSLVSDCEMYLSVDSGHKESLLSLAFSSYLRALSPPVSANRYLVLMKKLGNASNETGKYLLSSNESLRAAFRWFERGCHIFREIDDAVNEALLLANLSHLHKVLAQGSSSEEKKDRYKQAAQLCLDALQLLKQTRVASELQDKVKGELALTYLVSGVHLAENVHVSDKESANYALQTFNRALALYKELGDEKQAGSTHYQMAVLQAKLARQELAGDGHGKKVQNHLELARRSYERALTYFRRELDSTFVLIHQDLADLYALSGRPDDLHHALLLLLNVYDAFKIGQEEQWTALADSVRSRMKNLLHALIGRLSVSVANKEGDDMTLTQRRKKLEEYKNMYKQVLYFENGSEGRSFVELLASLRSAYLL